MGGFNSIVKLFMPKDRVFYSLFEDVAANLVEMGKVLVELVETKDMEIRKDKVHLIERLEHKNDDYTHRIFVELGQNFITPFDREDIHYLASTLDDVADYIHGSAKRIDMYKVIEINDSVRKLADLINQGVLELARAIPELRTMSNMRAITDACVKINSLENHADDIYDRAIADLFELESNAVELIKMREIYQALEIATDKCEDSANVIETIIIKYA
ncbi:phosphate transport regulator [Chitinophaga cymbidii]|uniref:Phosphate transport regulator n=2 Tax=Chitinophaga cymbidii TaxID=1096750 RepID=A0A512RIZ2_9BACT|nr:phosphate transport regulator [Chitinophaga cymbidii]